MTIFTWWRRSARLAGVVQTLVEQFDSVLHGLHRQNAESHQMSLDLTKLLATQTRLTAAVEGLIGVIDTQNKRIEELVAAASTTDPADQSAVDAATANLVAVADKAEVAAHPPMAPPATPPAP